jgi:hypothetical protein
VSDLEQLAKVLWLHYFRKSFPIDLRGRDAETAWGAAEDYHRALFKEWVSTVLAAMRGPFTQEMDRVGTDALNTAIKNNSSIQQGLGPYFYRAVWTAMIDHILADGFTTGDTLRTTARVPIGPDFPKTVYGSEGT